MLFWRRAVNVFNVHCTRVWWIDSELSKKWVYDSNTHTFEMHLQNPTHTHHVFIAYYKIQYKCNPCDSIRFGYLRIWIWIDKSGRFDVFQSIFLDRISSGRSNANFQTIERKCCKTDQLKLTYRWRTTIKYSLTHLIRARIGSGWNYWNSCVHRIFHCFRLQRKETYQKCAIFGSNHSIMSISLSHERPNGNRVYYVHTRAHTHV